jgi:hypothetical protein
MRVSGSCSHDPSTLRIPIHFVAMVAAQYSSRNIGARLHTAVAGVRRDECQRDAAHADGHVQIWRRRFRRERKSAVNRFSISEWIDLHRRRGA